MQSAPGPSVYSRPGLLSVTDPRLFALGQEARAASFARRLFGFAEVRSLEIDAARSTATVRYGAPPGQQQTLVGRFADALTNDESSDHETQPDTLPPWRPGETVKFRRHGALITTLEILTLDESYLEIRHRGIGRRDSPAARRVENALRQILGVIEANIDTGKLSIRLDAAVTSAAELVRRVETELLAPPDPHSAPGASKIDFDMANVSVSVAAVAEFVLPAVMPLAAGLLIVSNVDTVRAAGGQINAGKYGLPVLYTGIAALTLVSGQFLTAALMLWCFRTWEHRYQRDLEVENQAMLDEIVGAPGDALTITTDGLEQRVPVSEILVGQRIRVRAGECVPVDATVLSGAALMDESRLRGDPAPVTRIKGDEVLAGSRLLGGELELAVVRTGWQTRAAQVSRALIATTVPVPGEWTLNQQAETFADRTAGPTLLAGGLGLLVGGPAMSVAVMRSDYATGMGLAMPLETLRSVRMALRHGALLRSDQAFRRLAESSWVVLDDHEALGRVDCELAEMQVRDIDEDRLLPALAAAGIWLGDPRGPALVRACRARRLIARRAALRELGATFVEIEYGPHVLRLIGKADRGKLSPLRVELDGIEVARLRFQRTGRLAAATTVRRLQRAGLRVLLASERKPAAVAAEARKLGVDQFMAGADAESRRRLLRALSERGVSAVHVHAGPALRDAGDGHLSVALADADETRWHNADMVLFGQTIGPLPALAGLARDSMDRVAGLRRMAVSPNIACVAGAFAFGVPSMAVVFVSNLATSTVYNRARRALHLSSVGDTSFPEAAWCEEDESLNDDRSIQESDMLAAKEHS